MMNDITITITTPAAMREWSKQQQRSGSSIALVPTMGALHDGHTTLIRHALGISDAVVVSIFVNPLQFDRLDDFDRYPRPIDRDVATCEALGVAVVYAPTAGAMYPPGFQTRVTIGDLASTMEGASRPGHFDGVVTVVAKLFAAVRPDRAVFGEKDYQQLAVIRQMTSDLDLSIDIVAHPIIREPDGLAMSSRNVRLSPAARLAALAVPEALDAAVRVARIESSSSSDVIAAAVARIEAESTVTLDYVQVFDASSLAPVDRIHGSRRTPGQVRIAIAAFVGDVRLIDNRDPFD